MNKICAIARLLAVVLSLGSAFVYIPNLAAVLLVLGGISAINGNSEQNSRTFLITIVLLLAPNALGDLPMVGTPLKTMFVFLGTAAIGASIVAIAITFGVRIKHDWVK